MNRLGHTNANFFIGNEVEHTAMHGMRTLFVIGYQSTEAVQAALDEENAYVDSSKHIKHIFFGANDSYHPLTTADITGWENLILTFLDRGYWCSLDIPFKFVEQFNDGGLCERTRFVPIIKVPIPYVKLWNYNTHVKIDDRDFADTNPGVWVHSLHSLMDRSCFTDWGKYQDDQII